MVVTLIVPADLRYDDSLYKGVQETACEEDCGIERGLLWSGC